MADEFTVTCTISFSKGTGNSLITDKASKTNARFDQTGDGQAGGIQNIGIAAEAIDVGDVTSPLNGSWGFFHNTDDTNFVQIGIDVNGAGFEEFSKLEPGQFALLPLDIVATGVLQAKADTAAVELYYKIWEA